MCDQDPHAGTNRFSKNSNITKDKSNLKGTSTPFSRNQRANLSQSLSFPARGARADGLKKSIDAVSVKTEVKNRRVSNGTKTEVFSANGTVTSASRLTDIPNRRASTGVQPKEQNTSSGASVRRSSLASVPSIRRSVVRITSFSCSSLFFLLLFILRLTHSFVIVCIGVSSLGSLVP